MKRKQNYICRICLRVDRKLTTVVNELLDYHDDLCEYSTCKLKPLYCTECEHLLRKSYNFKQKCIRAMNIINKWKKSKQSVEDLCTLLPTHLSPWIENEHTACIFLKYNYDNALEDGPGSRNEVPYANTYNIVKLETGEDSIKLEDTENANDTENTNNKILKVNDQESIEVDNDKESIKQENEIQNANDTEHTNNKILEVNDQESIEVDNDKESIKQENEILHEKKCLEPIQSNIKETETILICTNEEDNESPTDYEYLNENELDSDDSEAPLSESIGAKKKKDVMKDKGIKRKVRKNGENLSKRKRVKLEHHQRFSKERLRTELEVKFESWGEVKAEDGTVIDKDLILNCLNDKINDYRMKQLWDSIQCEKPNPVTIRTFKHLMRLYTNEDQYTSVFDIEYLNTEEKMVEELQRRKHYECYLTAKFKCQKCYLVFYKPKHLENHIKMHEKTAGNFDCKICGVRYTTSKNLRSHVMSHGAAYKCKICPLVTYYRDTMINHFNQHEGKTYICESCGKVFKSLSSYKRHQYLSHRRGRHVCTTCGRAFVSELGVLLHKKKMHHNDDPPVESGTSVSCTECDLSFPSEQVLLKHKKTWHNEHRNLIKTKRTKPKYLKPPAIKCRACNASGSIGWLTLHFKTEHPTLDLNTVYADRRKHLCHICAKGFWSATSFRYHLNSHAGLQPYACDLCPKRYHSGVSLIEHRQRHFPPTKECKACGKKFKTTSNLTNHMLFHTGIRRHNCSICDKSFLHSSSLNEHIRGVHHNVRRVKRGARRGGKPVEDESMSGQESC